MTHGAHGQKDAGDTRGSRKQCLRSPAGRPNFIGKIGNGPATVNIPPDVVGDMAVRTGDIPTPDGRRRPIERSDTVHLQPLGVAVPQEASCEVTFYGTRDQFEVVIERRGTRFTLEGAGHTATLTGVFDDDGAAEKPERVPGWIGRVMEAKIDVHEVSLFNA